MVAPSDPNRALLSQPLPAATNRSVIDEDVERAFDLLTAYRQMLAPPRNRRDDQLEHALGQLERVIQTWLPRALASRNRLLTDVSDAMGDRDAVSRLLAAVELMPIRIECLQAVAQAEIRTRLQSMSPTAVCRGEIERWRSLLPLIRHKTDGWRYVEFGDVQSATFANAFWSGDLTSRLSRRGASYTLSEACVALVRWAHSQGAVKEILRPALVLVHRLQAHPDWLLIDRPELVRVVDEQVSLVLAVEALLVELDILTPITRLANSAATDTKGTATTPAAEDPGLKPEAGLRTSNTGSAPKTCAVELTGPRTAIVREGDTVVSIKGERRVWLLTTVMAAGRHLAWRDLIEGDIKNAEQVLDRRVKSKSAAGHSAPSSPVGSVGMPRMATQERTLQNLGSRIKRELGKLGYHWNQDGVGVTWSSDCQ